MKRADGSADTCNRCDGDKVITLQGKEVPCPQCGGAGTGESNAEQLGRGGKDVSIRAELLRGVAEQRLSPRSEFELREVPDGTGGTNLRFTGFASVTGDDAGYEIEDPYGTFVESVSVGAFRKTLSDGCDTAFLLNHTGMTLARTKSGTLKLSEETDGTRSPIEGVTGLHSEAMLDPKNLYVQAMRSAVDRSDLDEMSFAFRVMRQEWSKPDFDRRWINEVSLEKGDVSLVNYGASEHTAGTVTMRQKLGIRGTGDNSARLRAMRDRDRPSYFRPYDFSRDHMALAERRRARGAKS